MYLFVLGRNPELSVAEIVSYIEKEGNSVKMHSKNRNSVLVEVEKPLKKNIIKDLGGTISIGEIIISGNPEEIITSLERKEIYKGACNKFNYVIWNFCNEDFYWKISDYLKKRFRKEGLKATEKKLAGVISLQSGEKVPNLSSSLVGEEYFLFSGEENESPLYFGRIKERCDYEEIEKRDMGKPVRREMLSISPRLAKIMINLSMVKKNETLLDPFCGIGVILNEALIQGITVIGIDRDEEAINGARKNLEWSNFSKNNYKLINGDSSKIKNLKADVIVTEPDFGEALRKIPSKEKAEKMILGFENIIIKVLNNLKEGISGRIVFTSPLIKTFNGRISCNSDKISKRTGLRVIGGFPLQEFRKKQLVGREIFVLEK